MREIDRSGRATPVHQGEPAGVAVGKDARAAFDERQANFGDPFGAGDIFVGDSFRLGDGFFRGAGPGADAVQRVFQIRRCRAGLQNGTIGAV